MTTATEKAAAATRAKLVSDIAKKFGDNSIMLAKDMPVLPPVHSGSFALDYALGTGGLPPNRLIEVFGPESCGKTTLGLLSMRQFLNNNPSRHAIMLDLEHKMEKKWMIQILGDEGMERTLYIQPDHVEQATNIFVEAVGSGLISFCLFDSIGGAATKAVMEKDAEKQQVGGNAPQITKFSRLAATFSAKYECLTFCVNQLREDMEGFHRHLSPGGKALKHAAAARIFIRKSTRDTVSITEDGQKLIVGTKIWATIMKNQLGGIEGKVANWWFYSVPSEEHEFGIDTEDEIFNLATTLGVVQGTGWYRHPALPEDAKGERKVNGKEGLKELLRADESLRKTIVSETMAALKEHPEAAAQLTAEEPDDEIGETDGVPTA